MTRILDQLTPLTSLPSLRADERLWTLPDRLFDLVPVGIYVCDRAGLIVRYNRAAAELWGCSPRAGAPEARFCGSYRLYDLGGTHIPHVECPMAHVLATGQAQRDQRIVIERADGTRIPVLVDIEPLTGSAGEVVGAVNLFRDDTDERRPEFGLDAAVPTTEALLGAIVESSDDAILAKDVNGVINSWNRGAERLFGYAADEVIGKPVTILIPADRLDEEPVILGRILRGERIDHYETVRRRKDGSLVDISLTVSPVTNRQGKIIGASKIARDITERRRAAERQSLLLREMDHRVKNLFTLCASLVSLSARSARTAKDLAASLQQRLGALARAHALTLRTSSLGVDGAGVEGGTTLHALIRTILSPYDEPGAGEESRVAIRGDDVEVGGGSVTSIALLVHEFATNAAKYGALSTPAGRIDIECDGLGDSFVLTWRERGGPPVDSASEAQGFGSMLARTTVKTHLGGDIVRSWAPDGLTIRLSLDPARMKT